MNSYLIIPLLLGVVAVLQPMLNRVILDTKGISLAAFVNSVVLLIVATATLAFFHFKGESFPEYLRPKMDGGLQWWYVLPGIFGYLLVFFLPLSMRTLGAFATIAIFLASQLAFSFLYDVIASSKPITIARVLGLAFTAVGAYLSLRPAEWWSDFSKIMKRGDSFEFPLVFSFTSRDLPLFYKFSVKNADINSVELVPYQSIA